METKPNGYRLQSNKPLFCEKCKIDSRDTFLNSHVAYMVNGKQLCTRCAKQSGII